MTMRVPRWARKGGSCTGGVRVVITSDGPEPVLWGVDRDPVRRHGLQDLDTDRSDLGVRAVERASPEGVDVHLLVTANDTEGGVDHVAVWVHAEGRPKKRVPAA